MAHVMVYCPVCNCDEVVKRGKTEDGKQRYECQRSECPNKTFILNYSYKACVPGTKKMIIDMAMNGIGIRDTSRVLGISRNTVISETKKQESKLDSVNRSVLATISKASVDMVKAVHSHPGKCATELADLTGNRAPLHCISALLKRGHLEVVGREMRPTSSGSPREMNLYVLSVRGKTLLREILEEENRPKSPKGRVRYHTPSPTSQIALTGSRAAASVLPVFGKDNGCSVATSREPVVGYTTYVPPKPTGRGYVERPIKNIANM